MIEILRKELAVKGVAIRDDGVYFGGDKSSFDQIANQLNSRIEKNKKLLLKLTDELKEELSLPMAGDADKKTRRMFAHAIVNLYNTFINCNCSFELLKRVRDIVNSDSGLFSSKFMSKIIDYNLGVQWMIHLIRKDQYTVHLIKQYIRKASGGKKVLARGFGGPWGRLDLPMGERVFTWDDIAEETAGREHDKKTQRRYRMGLEGYQDKWPNEGYYWREIRNEPFAWGDEDSNPYPHRNVLWRS